MKFNQQRRLPIPIGPSPPKGADRFASGLEQLDWELVNQEPTVEGKAFQKMIDALMDQCFQWRTTTRREDEEPRVDDFLKRLWKRRRIVYDRDGRSHALKEGIQKVCQVHDQVPGASEEEYHWWGSFETLFQAHEDLQLPGKASRF